MTSHPYMVYNDVDAGLQFVWYGGAYIEICDPSHVDIVAFDVINVWDYETDTPVIERSFEGFMTAVNDWKIREESEGV